MTFLHPWALVGLLAAAVPLLLHLVERHRPVERSFPAVRYLEAATRDPKRRLRLRHLLLLLLRTLIVMLVVLAAAGPRLQRTVPLGSHSPMAVVLIVDNSASSTGVIDGSTALSSLLDAAREVLARAKAGDRLWLLLADGVARPGTATALSARLDEVVPIAVRLDLAEAIRHADQLIRSSGRPGEIVLLSDVQRTAVAAVQPIAPLVVLRPSAVAPANRALVSLDGGVQPWSQGGGRVGVAVASDDSLSVPVRLDGRDLLVTPGVPVSEPIKLPKPGWHLITATLPPDEFLMDNTRRLAVRVADPVAVSWDSGDRFMAAALTVLIDDGRLVRGTGVTVGRLGAGASIVQPPEDPAMVGALNRSLAARGALWRYGSVVSAAARTDSGQLLPGSVLVHKRVTLEPVGDGAGGALVTVAGEPWIVQSGSLVLLGSRLEPAWTELPVAAAFVPLLDALTTRVMQGMPTLASGLAGNPVTLPARVSRLLGPTGELVVEGGAEWIPHAVGVYWMLSGSDTVGALNVAIDPRESELTRATDSQLEAAWPGVVIADLGGGASRTMNVGGRGSLRPMLLLLALLAVVAESLVAGRILQPR